MQKGTDTLFGSVGRLGAFLFLFSAIIVLAAEAKDTGPGVFRAGDGVEIKVFPEDSGAVLSSVYPVDGLGYADFPILGLVKVTERTERTLAEELKRAYTDYLHYPNIQVRPVIRVSLLGGFQQPGLYWVDPRWSLWSAIRLGGGPQREDGVNKMWWERDRTVVKSNLVPDFESGQSLRQIGFKSGDQIRVTASPMRTAWQIFREDILPLITFGFTATLTALTVWEIYQD